MKKRNNKQQIARIAAMLLSTLLIVALMPLQPNAAVKGSKGKKAKAKYSVSVENINADTVIKKGSSIKVQYKAICQKGNKTSRAKVRFKSSNKKIATVSSKGVIKAKKNGTVKITVYCKKSPKKKKTVKIRVGNPVSQISVSGYQHLRVGRKTTIKAQTNSDATNKKIIWTSDNPSVVSVDAYGNINALTKGNATVYATAADGSGKSNSISIGVYKYSQNNTKWIAHRGLHTSAIENTADAFIAAGCAEGFWGCECDIWETKHETIEADPQNQPGGIATDDSANEQTVVVNDEIPDDVADEKIEDVIDEVKYNETENETELPLNETYETNEEIASKGSSNVETFDIVINHDDTFNRTFGLNTAVKKMTAREIRDQLPKVCFFDEYLDICKQYSMVPVVEFKDPQMSEEAINKVIEMLEERSLLESALLISFYPDILEKAKACANSKLDDKDVYTAFLTADADLGTALSISKQKGFDCVSSYFGHVDTKAFKRCIEEGLRVGTWTYGDDPYSDEMLYEHLLSNQYMLDFATVDYKPW